MDDKETYPPEKKMFEDWTYDEKALTFKGNISWSPITFAGV